MFTIRRGPTEEARAIWNAVAPADKWHGDDDLHWIVYNASGKPVAFASMVILSYDNGRGDKGRMAYMTMAGVLPEARGHHLQRRLIRARVQAARREGLDWIITYTLLKNYPSMCNLLACGFEFYEPEDAWVGDDVHYYRRDLTD